MIIDSTVPNKLKIDFDIETSLFSAKPEGNYQVLDTDYNTYSLVYSCSKFLILKFEYAWLLSRSRTLPAKEIDRLEKKFGQGIVDQLVTVSQSCDN
jgi:apolipoprotein D and lipocalin family protein